MKPTVQKKELGNLIKKNQQLKKQLDSLERDYRTWNEKRERDDLENITATIKKLEAEVSQTMSDFSALADQNGKPMEFYEDFHYSFAILSDLFESLKKIRGDLEKQSHIQVGKINHMEIDWVKLRKAFEMMGNHFTALERENDLSFF